VSVHQMPLPDSRDEKIVQLSVAIAQLKATNDFFNDKSLGYMELNNLYGKYSRPARAYIKTTIELRSKHEQR